MLRCTPLGARSPASYIPLGRLRVKGESGRRKGCFAIMLPKVRTPFNACPAEIMVIKVTSDQPFCDPAVAVAGRCVMTAHRV